MNIVSDLIRISGGKPHLLPRNKKHRNRTGTPRIYPAFRNEAWNLTPGGSYYVTRNGSSLIAFTIPARGPGAACTFLQATATRPALRSRNIRSWRQKAITSASM